VGCTDVSDDNITQCVDDVINMSGFCHSEVLEIKCNEFKIHKKWGLNIAYGLIGLNLLSFVIVSVDNVNFDVEK